MFVATRHGTREARRGSSLRTPPLAYGDDDLFRFRAERGAHFSYLADQPDTVTADVPVRTGLGYLRSLYDQHRCLAHSELLIDGMEGALDEVPDGVETGAAARGATQGSRASGAVTTSLHLGGRAGAALASASRPRAVAHQRVDLATGAEIAPVVAAHCEAGPAQERTEAVQQFDVSALGSPSVQEVARHPHWWETYVFTPVGGRLLEGYTDLLYRGPRRAGGGGDGRTRSAGHVPLSQHRCR